MSKDEAVVEASGLTKRYGRDEAAVDGLDLEIHRGEIYGLLGPNGAGKTTTLRMLLGLIRPTSGDVRVLGADPGGLSGIGGVGSLVEEPTFYPYLSGRENLGMIARLSGLREAGSNVEEALSRVGLKEASGSKFKKYSLGMKQRLGVAAALVADPQLLIMDEPTNGLDPRGMAEMRDLILALGQGERTVVLSSHLMGEVEQTCDRVGMIQRGQLVAEGGMDEIRGSDEVVVRAEPVEEALGVAGECPQVQRAELAGEDCIRLLADQESIPEVVERLVGAGVRVKELRPQRRSLESAFLELTDSEEV